MFGFGRELFDQDMVKEMGLCRCAGNLTGFLREWDAQHWVHPMILDWLDAVDCSILFPDLFQSDTHPAESERNGFDKVQQVW